MMKLSDSELYKGMGDDLARTIQFILNPPPDQILSSAMILESIGSLLPPQIKTMVSTGKIRFFAQTKDQMLDTVVVPTYLPVWLGITPGGMCAYANVTPYINKPIAAVSDIYAGWAKVAKILLDIKEQPVTSSYTNYAVFCQPYIALLAQCALRSYAALKDYNELYTRLLSAFSLWFMKLYQGFVEPRIAAEWGTPLVQKILGPKDASLAGPNGPGWVLASINPNDHHYFSYFTAISELLDLPSMANRNSSNASTFPYILRMNWLQLCGEASAFGLDNFPYYAAMMSAAYINIPHYNNKPIVSNKLVAECKAPFLKIFGLSA